MAALSFFSSVSHGRALPARKHWVVPVFVLVIGWTACASFLAFIVRRQGEMDARDFNRLCLNAEQAVVHRVETSTATLEAGASLVHVASRVERVEWEEFVTSLDVVARYPGIRGLGVIYPVNAADTGDFVRRVRADNAPEFTVHGVPGGRPSGDALAVVTFLEPESLNRNALGLDMYTEPHRREAALAARDTGEPQLTRRIALVQDGGHRAGAMLYVPVYRAGEHPRTLEERRAAHVAWVFAPLVMDELWDGAIGRRAGKLELQLFEGLEATPESMLVDSTSASGAAKPVERISHLKLTNRDFTLAWRRGPGFIQAPLSPYGWLGGAAAVGVALLAGLVWSLLDTSRRAQALAHGLTHEMASTQGELESLLRIHRDVLDGTVHGIIGTTPAGLVTVFNTGAEKMLGYFRQDVIGRMTPVEFHVAAELQARATELQPFTTRPLSGGFEVLVARAAAGQVDEREWTYVRRDGTRLPVLLSVTAQRNVAGEITGFLVIAHDLTDRKKAEVSYRASEERLARVLGHAECLVWEAKVVLQSDDWVWSTAVFPSGLYAKLFGDQRPADSAGLWQQFNVPERAEINHRCRDAMQRDLGGYAQEFRLVRDGEVTWIRESVAITREGPDQFWVVGVAFDITDRKRAEAQLRHSLMEVTNLKTALDAHAIVATTDAHGIITYVNEKFLQVSQYRAEELIGHNHRLIKSGRHSREFFRDLWTTISAGRIWRGEMCNRSKDGALYWVDATIVPFLGEDGKPVQYIAIRTDITERKQLEQNLAIARDQALEASRLKSEFLATMSHEIRTPMNAIIGMGGLLADSPLSPEQADMIRILTGAAESLLTIINDILDFSRIEAGQLRLDVAEFDLARVIEETVALLAPRAHEKRIELSCDFQPTPEVMLLGDAGRVRQILMNLVGNAVKFTDTGEVVVTCATRRSPNGGMKVTVAVRDTGIGIPAEARGRLFRPFVQVDGSATRRFGGTGLGLAITHQLVSAMGGSVSYESEPGRGSNFVVEMELPCGTGAVRETPRADLAGRRVLVVDDNQTNRSILVRQLQHRGAVVEAMADAPSALNRLRDQARPVFDVAVLDWAMPGVNGLDLALTIRAEASTARLPIVMLSSVTTSTEVAVTGELGVAAVLLKPVSEAKLTQCLGRVLNSPASASPGVPSAPADAGGAGLLILLVEDNEANQRVATLLLRKLGHRVDLATNGHQALERLVGRRYDVVLMDCQMPYLDGYETTRWIRAGKLAGVDRNVPVIALTAYARSEDRARCIAAGMNGYISKPIRAHDIEEALNRIARRDAPAAVDSAAAVLAADVVETARALPGASGPSLLPELVELYLREEPARLRRITQLAADRSTLALAEEAHGLGGNAASFGGIEVRRVALEVEHAARSEQWSEVDVKLLELSAACLRLRGAAQNLRFHHESPGH